MKLHQWMAGCTMFGLLAMTTAARASVVDFENYTVGESVSVCDFCGPAIEGTPYPILYIVGQIGEDPAPGIDKYIDPIVDPSLGYQRLRFVAPNIDGLTRYAPTLRSFDVYLDGAWETRVVNKLLDGHTTFKFHAGHVFLDNFIFDDATIALPEPSTWATMIMGFGVVGAMFRRRRPAKAVSQP